MTLYLLIVLLGLFLFLLSDSISLCLINQKLIQNSINNFFLSCLLLFQTTDSKTFTDGSKCGEKVAAAGNFETSLLCRLPDNSS